jgi:hypothetical protein
MSPTGQGRIDVGMGIHQTILNFLPFLHSTEVHDFCALILIL